MYGGITAPGGGYTDEVWVLSVPAFRWIAINDTNNEERLSDPAAGRHGHTCTMWRDSQMIVLGGIYARPAATPVTAVGTTHKWNVSVCDTVYSPLRLLDTSTYSWQKEYIPSGSPYSVPAVVSDIIGGR